MQYSGFSMLSMLSMLWNSPPFYAVCQIRYRCELYYTYSQSCFACIQIGIKLFIHWFTQANPITRVCMYRTIKQTLYWFTKLLLVLLILGLVSESNRRLHMPVLSCFPSARFAVSSWVVEWLVVLVLVKSLDKY